jgi:AroM protein.
MKIGAITVGQAPRVDVTADIMDILGPGTELLERGGLDGLTREEIEAFAPQGDDYVLVSRLTDGSSVTFAEKYVIPRLQAAIRDLEAAGVTMIMVFCTGAFPAELTSSVPMLFPNDLIQAVVPLLTRRSSIITVTPSPLQIEQNQQKWQNHVKKCTTIAVSPYGDYQAVAEAAAQIADTDADLIVLDCIGFTKQMKELFMKVTGKPVVLPRTLLARVAAEAAAL